jgi:hypothetical protein
MPHLGLKAGIHGVQVVQPNEVVEGKRNLYELGRTG